MNKVYRVIWNASKGVWQAVGEIGSNKGKSRCRGIGAISLATIPSIAGSLLLISPMVLAGALPSGGQVASGSAEISVSGNKLQVLQSSNKVVIDWQSFSIGEGNEVEFSQSSSQAAALNRVTGSQVSDIRGSLKANGQVFLINPNGVLFSATSEVNVGALVASTLDISNEDFINGDYSFEGAGTGTVINRGNIRSAEGGFVAMIAASVVNEGSIDAFGGTIAMAAGKRIVLDMGGPVKVSVEEGALDAYVEQGGAVRVGGGIVLLTAKTAGELSSSVINHTGITEAQTLQTGENGRIVLAGDGEVSITGTLDATSAEGKGGEIQVTGAEITLLEGALLDASGRDGGGQILVGGDYQGKNAEVPNAIRTYVNEGARIVADATGNGDGGKIVVWADEHTEFSGHISAKGGAQGGDGGFVEVSGKQTLDFQGTVDLTAAHGTTGTLLLDPTNLTISAGSDSNVTGSSPYMPATATGSVINVSTLAAALENANVTVTTNSGFDAGEAGNITVANSIGWFSDSTLTLDAAGAITINDDVNIQTFDGSLVLTAGSDITQIHATGGKFLIGGTTTAISGGNITLTSTANQLIGTVVATANTGAIAITNSRSLVLGDVSASGLVALKTVDNAGSITVNGAFSAGELNAAAHTAGGISIADVNGDLTVSLLEAGGAITLGNAASGTLTFTHGSDGSNVIVGNDAADGQASGVVTIIGHSLVFNDGVRTKGGTVNLESITGSIMTASDADIVTTADIDTGTASGLINITAANGMTLQNITTTGADNQLGVGSNAAAVTLTATTGDIAVGAITTTGGDAVANVAYPNRSGGNAGSILIEATTGVMSLNGDLNAAGGGYYGFSTQGLGGYIHLKTPAILTANRVISSGATSGYIDIDSTINSGGAAYSLNVVAGTGHVTLDGVIGGTSPLASLTVSGAQIDVEKNVTTNEAAGVDLTAGTVRLGDQDLENGSGGGAITINTLAGNGVVDINAINTYLDDDVIFTRGSGEINVSNHLYSNTSERNDLTFNGAEGGAVVVGGFLGGTSATSDTKLGDILFETVTDITIGQSVSAASLISLNGTGRINLGQNSSYSHYYDAVGGLQLATTGTNNVFGGDENFYFYGDVTNSNATAPISVSTPNGNISFYYDADLVTAGGDVILKAGNGALALGSSTDITTNNGLLSLTGIGVSQSATNSVLNAGSGKIRIDGGGAAVSLYGRLITTDDDSLGTPSILVSNATGANFRSVETQTGTFQVGLIAGDANLAAEQTVGGAENLTLTTEEIRLGVAQEVTITSAGDDSASGANVTFTVTGTAANGDPLVELIVGGNAAAVTTTGLFKTITSIASNKATTSTVSVGLAADDAISGSLTQYPNNSYSDSQIDIKTLSAATKGAISITSTENIIDELGDFSVGSTLTVQASGRLSGMALTGDVAATSVTIKTGVGALALGGRDIAATSGNIILQGRGVTQEADSTVSATGTVTVYGSDYASQSIRGDVVMAGHIIAGSTASNAVTIADANAITTPSITTGSVGSRGGLRLGTHDHNGSTYRRAYGAIDQTAGSLLTIGALDIRQNSSAGAIDLSLVTNEIQSVTYVERGGAITLYDKDTEANGLSLSNIYDGSFGNLLKATTEGAMTLSGTNRGKGMELTAGAGGFIGSGSIEGHQGGAGLVKITTTGALALTSGTLYAKGVQLTSGALGITSNTDIQAHHSGGGDLILDAGGGDITLTQRLYNRNTGTDIVLQNANDVQLQRVELNDGKLILGGALTGPGTALTGNVTQTSYITAYSDTINMVGEVAGAVTLNSTNQIYRMGDFTTGDYFTFSNQDRTLTLDGAIESTDGNVSISNRRSLTVSSAATVDATAENKGVTLTASSNEWNYTANILGAITAGTGGLNLSSTYGYVSTSGAGTLTSKGAVNISSAPSATTQSTNYYTSIDAAVSAGEGGSDNITINSYGTFTNGTNGSLTATGGVVIKTDWNGTQERNMTLSSDITAGFDGVKLTSSGTINQTGGVIVTTGTLSGANQSGGIPTSSLPSARGAVTLTANNEIANLGPFYLYDEAQVNFTLNDVSGGLTLAGTIENSHGAINISTAGGVLDLTSYDVYAGGMASGGAAVTLTGQGINQGSGSEISTTGGTTGSPRTGSNGGGIITLTGHDGVAAGAISLAGGISTVNDSTSAITIRGTTDLQLPGIIASKGSLVLGDDTATIGLITGNITQAVSTALDIKTLQVGTATNAVSGSVVLANSTNKIETLAGLYSGAHQYVGPETDIQYDLDIYDSTGGLNLTAGVVSDEGVRIQTTDATTGVLSIGANSISASGDIYLSGLSVTQADGSTVNADNSGAGGIGGSIRIDGGGGASNITLEGMVTTDSTSATAIEIVNATNATLHMVSASAGTVVLGVDTKELTGTVSQLDANSTISAATLVGDAGVVTINKANIDNLGLFTTGGAFTLVEQGGSGAAGLTYTGSVITGGTTWIETTDGIQNLASQTLDATGQALTLKGIGLSQEAASVIKSTTADLYGGAGDIDLFSTANDFTGQVTVNSTGSHVNLQDANQLSMNTLTGKLATTTSIKLHAGTYVALTTENLTTTSGDIEFKSLGGLLNTPGKLTTGSGNITLYASETLSLAEKILSTSGDIDIEAAIVASRAGAEDYIQTAGAGAINIRATSGNFTQGSDVLYKTVDGDITLSALAGNATLANVQSSTGDLHVTAGGNIQQLSGSAINVAGIDALTKKDAIGNITLTESANNAAAVRLRTLNGAGDTAVAGVIQYEDADGFSIREILTTADTTLIARGDITADSIGYAGTVTADTFTVKTRLDAGAGVDLTQANNVNSLNIKVRTADDSAIAGETTTPTGTIRFTDSDGFVVTAIETGGTTVLTAGDAVTQTGAISSAKLGLSGAGDYTLNLASSGAPVNQISTFASDSTGAVNFTTNLDLVIGTVNPVGITTKGADISITAPTINSSGVAIDTRSDNDGTAGGSVILTTSGSGALGNLTVGDIVTSGTAATASSGNGGGAAGMITLTSSGDLLTVDGAISARGGAGDGIGIAGADGTIKLLSAAGAVLQADGATEIDAGKVLLDALNSSALLDLNNTIDLISARIGGVGQDFTYRSGSDFSVGGGENGIEGITTQGGLVDIGSSDYAISVTQNIITKGGAFTATGVRSFNYTGVTISTAGDVGYASAAYKNGGTINIATTANNGNVNTGTLISSGDVVNAGDSTAGNITLNANGELTVHMTQAQGKGSGTGGVVSLTGSTVNIAGSIDTSSTGAAGGMISVNGPAVLVGGDHVLATGSGAGDINFTSLLNSDGTSRALTITAGAGDIIFNGAVGGNSALGALNIVSANDVTMNDALTAASFTQSTGTGTSTLGGVVTLSDYLAFTGNNLSVNAATGVGGVITISNAGLFTTAAAGDITSVGTFGQIGAGTNALAGDINTTNADISFATGITFTGDMVMSTNTGAGNIVFADILNSDTTPRDLTLSSGTGNVTFAEVVGGVNALGMLAVNSAGVTKFSNAVTAASVTTDAAGTVEIKGKTVNTSGTQTYNDTVYLGDNTTLTGSIITTNDAIIGANHSLLVAGDAVLGDAADDSVTGLTTLEVTGATTINADTITSADAQTYTGAVILGNSATLTAADDPILFSSTVNSEALEYNGLTVNAGSGAVTFAGAVGDAGDAAPGAVIVNSTGVTQLLSTVKAGSLVTNAGGTVEINGGDVTTSGVQTYGENVTLGANTVLTGTTITANGTVSGAGNYSLGITGDAVFGDGPADTVTGLTTLAVSGTTAINTTDITSSGTQAYTGDVTLGTDTALTAAKVTTNGKVIGGTHSLDVTGNAVFGDEAADTVTGLNTLAVSGTTTINTSNVTSSSTQVYTGDVDLGADTILTATTVTTNGKVIGVGYSLGVTGDAVFGNDAADTISGVNQLAVSGSTAINSSNITTHFTQDYTGVVTLGADTTVDGVGISFYSAIVSDGTNRALIVNDSGTTIFGGAVGSTTAAEQLTSLTTDAGGSTAINGGAVYTTAAQTYNDNVTLAAGTTLSGTTITTNGTLVGGSNSLAITGDAVFGNDASDTVTGLTTLAVSGTTTINTSNVTGDSTQDYTGVVTLGAANTTLTGVGITFTDNVISDGTNRSLDVIDSGTTTFGGLVGTSNVGEELSFLTTDAGGSTVINGGAVNTTQEQIYNDDVILGADTTLTGTKITTAGSVVGADNVLDVIGDAVFGDTTGDTVTGLATLAVSGTTAINSSVITSTGTQDYTGAVTVGDDAVLTTANANVTFLSTINSVVGAKTLEVNAGAGDITLSDNAGSMSGGLLGGLTLTGTNLSLNDVTTIGSQTYNGATTTNSTLGSISIYASTDSDITFNGNVVMNNDLMVTTGAGVGAITFTGTLDNVTGEANNLYLTAGAGNIDFDAAVGATDAIGAFNISSATNVTADSTIAAASVTQSAGTGTTTLNGAVNTSNVAGISLTATNLAVNAAMTTINAGTVTFNESGAVIISAAGDINSDGGVNITAGGGIATAGDITTTGDAISLNSAVMLTGDSALSTGGTAGAINFASTIDGAHALRLLSGAAQSFNAVGGTTPLTLLRVESTGAVTQTASMKVGSLAIKSAGATLSNMGNDVNTLAALLSGDAALVFVDVDGVEIGTIDADALQIVGISDGAGTSDVSITVGGLLSQAVSSPILIDGNFTADTTAFDADDVSLKNTSAGGTELDNSLVAGDFSVNSTGDVTQKIDANGAGADAWVQVGGSFNMTGTGVFVEGNSTDNLIGGGSAGTAANEIRLFGVITLSMNTNGDLVAVATTTGSGTTSTDTILAANLANGAIVTSDAGGKSISAVTDGDAILLNANNTIGGTVKITTQGAYSNAGTPVATGILQSNALTLDGNNRFLAMQSTENTTSGITGAGAIDLSNVANTFAGMVSATAVGMDIHLRDSDALDLGTVNGRDVTIELANGSTDTITQTGVITATNLLLQNAGAVTLNNNNRIATVAANVNGAFSLANNQPLTVGMVNGVNGLTVRGDITLTSDALAINQAITAAGFALTLKPLSSGTSIGLGDGVGDFSIDATEWNNLTDGFSSIIVGRNDGTGKITTGALTVNDNLTLLNANGGMEISGHVDAGSNTIILDSTGAVTDTGSGSITAASMALQGIGAAYTLDAINNDVDLLSANTGSVTYVDTDALAINTFNGIDGITATGAVNISTLTNDLTVSQTVTGTTTIKLNAGVSAAAGAAGGGDIVLAGSPSLTATAGSVILYTGSITGSTGMAGTVVSGSGNFRYNADETTDFSAGGWTDLGATGIYAIYREQPVISVAAGHKTVTYGDADPTNYTASYSGLINGDTAAIISGTVAWDNSTLTTGTTSTGGKRIVGDYNVAYNSGLSNGLGYGFADNTSSVNELTVGQLTLLGSIAGGGNTYGSAVTAGSVAFSNLIAGDLVTSDTVIVDTSGLLSTSGNLKAGTHTGIQAVGTVLSGADGGNYDFAGASADYIVDQLALTLSGITAASRVYDASIDATVAVDSANYTGLIAGDVVTVAATGVFDTKHADIGKTVNLTSTYSGADVGNYSITDQAMTTANVTAKAITISGIAAENKVYDANTTATINVDSAAGWISTDDVTVAATGVFDTKHVGSGKVVTLTSGYGGTDIGNYIITDQASTTADVTAKAITISGITASGKIYDGNAVAATNVTGATGWIAGDVVTVAATGAFDTKHVGTGKKVTLVSTYGGVDKDNYSITDQATTSADIGQASLVVTTSDVVKTYDGTLSATGSALATSGTQVFAGDSLTGGTYAFTDTHVSRAISGDVLSDKTVTAANVTVNDGNNGNNYLVTYADNTTSTINPVVLSLGLANQHKTYDGSTDAAIDTAGYSLTGFVGTEGASVTETVGLYDSKDVLTASTVTVALASDDFTTTGLTVLGDYILPTSVMAAGQINTKSLTAVVDVQDRTYDATANATLNGITLKGLIGTETLGVAQAIGGTTLFDDKHAAADKRVTVTGVIITPNTGLMTNYQISSIATTTATISKKTLTVEGVVALNKVYDGTTTTQINTSVASLNGKISGDVVAIGSMTGSFLDKNVGVDKVVNGSDVLLLGSDAGNYDLIQPTGLQASITPRELRVVLAGAEDKIYDGNTDAVVTVTDNRISGDLLNYQYDADFIDKNVGYNKFVGVSNISFTGGVDMTNYTVNTTASGFAAIIPKSITISGISADDKVYDRTSLAVVDTTNASGWIAGDDLNVSTSGVFSDYNPGANKTVYLTSSYTGVDFGNYIITDQATTTADIVDNGTAIGDGVVTDVINIPSQVMDPTTFTLSGVTYQNISSAEVNSMETDVRPAGLMTVFVVDGGIEGFSGIENEEEKNNVQ
ncbi:MAG: filamentous hemagglutinin N-terminal domain-containing protein [Oceanospirillales bacterium]|nr:filamentous hemagglutinin N-terminal domain-containing protein [Oceanospirillales bacterium]